MEMDAQGHLRTSYTLGNGRILQRTPDGGTVFPLDSGLNGTSAALTDRDGAIVARYAYDAFGYRVRARGEVRNSYGFGGAAYEAEVGLLYVDG